MVINIFAFRLVEFSLRELSLRDISLFNGWLNAEGPSVSTLISVSTPGLDAVATEVVHNHRSSDRGPMEAALAVEENVVTVEEKRLDEFEHPG